MMMSNRALGDVLQFLAHALGGGDEVARQHHDPRLGKQRGGFFLDALDARTAGDEAVAAAHFGHAAGCGAWKAAMMADQLAA